MRILPRLFTRHLDRIADEETARHMANRRGDTLDAQDEKTIRLAVEARAYQECNSLVVTILFAIISEVIKAAIRRWLANRNGKPRETWEHPLPRGGAT